MAVCKGICRLLTITGLATGAAVVIAGPERIAMLAGQARDFVVERIDGAIEDPVAMRAQLKELETQYPKRIAEVRGELASLDGQINKLARDQKVAQRVVDLASDDLDELEALLAHADEVRSNEPSRVIRVRFDGQSVPLEDAFANATRLTGTIQLYNDRAAGAARDLELLNEQRTRLSDLVTELETEHAQFQSQLAQLEGQIEMIARNDTLIDLMERREATIDEIERFEAASLDHFSARMSQVRAQQESRLASLFDRRDGTDYEQAAKAMLDAETIQRDAFESTRTRLNRFDLEQPIEITPSDVDAETSEPVARLD